MSDFTPVAVWLAVAILAAAIVISHHRGILAVAFHSFRQFLQIRFFLPCFLLLCATIVFIAVMKPANPSDHLRLLQTNIFGAANFVVAIIVLTHAATSFPREVSQKQTYHIFSKPLSRSAFIAGRVLGYSIAGSFLLLIALLLNLTVIGFFSLSDSHFNSSRQTKEYICARSHSYAGKEIESVPDSVVWLDSPGQGVSWNFTLPALHRRISTELTPAVAGAITTEALIRAKNAQGEEIERKTTLSDNRPSRVEFEFQRESRAFSVAVVRTPDSAPIGFNIFRDDMGFEKNGLHVVTDTASFELNLALGYLIIFWKVSLFAAIGVFCSSFLSAPVAVFFALFLYLLSHLVPFLSFAAAHIGEVQTHSASAIPVSSAQPTFFDHAMVAIINGFCSLFPDSLRFDLSSSVCAGRSLSLLPVASSLLYYGKYLLLLVLLGIGLLRREV
jgi:hypothetical protein